MSAPENSTPPRKVRAAGAPSWDEMALVGRVARAHGNRGEVVINAESDFPEHRFRTGGTLYLKRDTVVTPMQITAVRFQRERPIVAFQGIDSIASAEQLASAELRVPIEDLAVLPPDTYYRHDLVGADVITTDGEPIGTVSAVEGDMGGSRLVTIGTGGEVLIPMVSTICVSIDVPGRRIVIKPLEGLIELNWKEGAGGRYVDRDPQ